MSNTPTKLTNTSVHYLHSAKPVSITLRNQLLPNARKIRKDFIAWGSVSHLRPMLLETRLEIRTINEEEEEEVLYVANHVASLHPQWDNLEKSGHFSESSLKHGLPYTNGNGNGPSTPTIVENDAGFLRSFARVLVRLQSNKELKHSCSTMENWFNDDDSSSTSSSDDSYFDDSDGKSVHRRLDRQKNDEFENGTFTGKESKREDYTVLAEIPLHPTNLRHLPTAASDVTKLRALPPNTLVVKYSDGSVRITPGLYNRLMKERIITEDIMSPKDYEHAKVDLVEQKKREQRFNDDAFDILNDSTSLPSVHKRNESPNTSFFEEDAFDLLNMGDNDEGLKPRSQSNRLIKVSGGEEVVATKASKLPIPKDDSYISTEKLESHPTIGDKDRLTRKIVEMKDKDRPYWNEIDRQSQLLSDELENLEIELEEAQGATNILRELMNHFDFVKAETVLLNESITQKSKELARTEFLLESRRVKMLKDLREIYPIQSLPNNRYAIRGLELPSDMNFVDDHVSSALGFTCHLVYMSSKYLAIPLRYRLICNASRSAVQDGDNTYPLFRTNVERPNFDRAVLLLERNIEFLLKVRGVQYLPRTHLLAKLDRLYIQTTEGGIFYHR